MDDALFAQLRATEYSRLDADNQAYLDYTGSALYAERQIVANAERMRRTVLGNPHSENGPSLVSTAIINGTRRRLLAFLDAPESEYIVVFTANTSAAIKLVAESYRFGPASPLVLAADNHNSMNGIREFARAKNAAIHYIGLDENLRLDRPVTALSGSAGQARGLFGYPAQSNFSGVKHQLSLIENAQRLGYRVVLDAAAFLPTNRLSLTHHPADFVALSLYKITGFPTGVGALVARRDALQELDRPWFAGGTVEYASVQHGSHMLRRDNGEGFEDGTPAFLSIAAASDGLDLLDEIGMDRINAHVMSLTSDLVQGLKRMRHSNGRELVTMYGERAPDRGATVAFNVHDKSGRIIPFAHVVERARNEGVSLRGGCFCNPGASEAAFHFPFDESLRCFQSLGDEFSIEALSRCLGPDVAVGAVRASLGLPTNRMDVARALSVIETFA
jgi:selenocysteine lyase/cysteine desulfurase